MVCSLFTRTKKNKNILKQRPWLRYYVLVLNAVNTVHVLAVAGRHALHSITGDMFVYR